MTDKQAENKAEAFHAILASSVHDMKNSLGMLINTVEEMATHFTAESGEIYQQFTYLESQAARMNNDLMQLLSFYKIENNHYPFAMQEVELYDFLDDQTVRYAFIAERKKIAVQLECDEALLWNFDHSLVAGVLNDSLGNALRYTDTKVLVSASEQQGYLRICVEDDGAGFPESLVAMGHQGKKGISYQSGSTGLGLFFCSTVAAMHRINNDCGYIEIDNQSRFGGGRFSLFLP